MAKKKIKSVFLFAIAKEYIVVLDLLYKIIIKICSHDEYAHQLSKLKSFPELKAFVRKIYLDLQ